MAVADAVAALLRYVWSISVIIHNPAPRLLMALSVVDYELTFIQPTLKNPMSCYNPLYPWIKMLNPMFQQILQQKKTPKHP